MRIVKIKNGKVENIYIGNDDHVLSADELVDDGTSWIGGVVTNGVCEPLPEPVVTLESYRLSAKAALVETKETMERIMEAVSLGNTTLQATDVILYMQYRADLRAEIKASTVGTLPAKPPYPAGT